MKTIYDIEKTMKKAKAWHNTAFIVKAGAWVFLVVGVLWLIHDGLNLVAGDTRGELLGACILESVGDIIRGAVFMVAGYMIDDHADELDNKVKAPTYTTRRGAKK